MEKKFSKIEISVIKTTAKNMAKFVASRQKVEAQIKEVEEKVAEQIKKRAADKIAKLEEEKAGYQSIIDSMNEPIKRITGGYEVDDLVTIKKVGTGVMDSKSGKEIMKTVPELKYPGTVIPPTELQSEEAPVEAAPEPVAVEMPEHGNDFDLDRDSAMAEGFNPWDN